MRSTCPVLPPVCSAANRNPWFAQNTHATNFLCSIELICLICLLKIVMIIHVPFCTTCRKCGMWVKTVLMDNLYITQRLMALMDSLEKIYYSPLKSNPAC